MIIKQYALNMMLLGCLWGTIGTACWAENTVHWGTVNYPPAYFVDGSQQGKGFCDVAGEQFRQTLATYHHQLIANVSQARMSEFWKETEQTYCIPGLGATVGQFPHTVSSKAMSIVPPPGIVIRKAEMSRFITSLEEQASLERLLQDSTLKLGLFGQQQNGERIDALLKRYRGQPHVYERVVMDTEAILKMLNANRLDYVLMWAFAVQTAFETLTTEERESLMFLSVLEAPAPLEARAICNDTPLGRQVIEQINQALTTETYKTVVTERLLEFLPENLRDEYRSLNLQRIGQ